MEVLNGEAVLYAGAGVTAYSNPADEWLETELKCNTLLNIIHG
jgi:isochorismate synthase